MVCVHGLRFFGFVSFCVQPLFQTDERDAGDAVEGARHDGGLAEAETGIEPAGSGVFCVRVNAQHRAAERAGAPGIKAHELRAVAVPGDRRVNDERVQHEHLLRRRCVLPRHLRVDRHLRAVDASGGDERTAVSEHKQCPVVERCLRGRARRIDAARPADAGGAGLLCGVDRVVDLLDARQIVCGCGTDVGRILRTFKIKKNVEVTDNGKIII